MFLLRDQFSFCKQFLIGSVSTLTFETLGIPHGGSQGMDKQFSEILMSIFGIFLSIGSIFNLVVVVENYRYEDSLKGVFFSFFSGTSPTGFPRDG